MRDWTAFHEARRTTDLRLDNNQWRADAAAPGLMFHEPAEEGITRQGLIWKRAEFTF